jgi:DegV family protein with EDD domain
MTVKIVTDSAADLTPEQAAAHDITVVPLTIRFGDDEYVDVVDLTPQAFYDKMAELDVLPATAAPSPGAFEMAFREAGANGDPVVCINLSAELSATMQSAQTAAKAIGDDLDLTVLDSQSITAGLAMQVLAAAELAEQGGSVADIVALIEDMRTRAHVFGALDTLDNLRKGGRIGNAKALLATALNIKPIIEVADGVVEQHGKQRTRSKALTFLVEKVASYRGRIEHLAVLHADCSDIDAFVERLRPLTDGEIVVGQIGPVIGAHAGRGTIGVAFHERS